MAQLNLAYKARAQSTGTPRRVVCSARDQYLVADGSGGEAIGAGELFLGGIAVCAITLVERIADEQNVSVDWMDVSAEAYSDPDRPRGDVTVFDKINVRFQLWGVSQQEGELLVALWKKR